MFTLRICMLFYINDLHSKRQKSEDVDSVSDIKSENLTLLTFINGTNINLCQMHI